MCFARTTSCCSAFALLLGIVTTAQTPSRQPPSGSSAASGGAPASPPSLFPAVATWKLALNNDLTAPPAMAGTSGYFPIAGDRLAAYDIESGRLRWLVDAATTMRPAIGSGLVFVIERASLTAFRDDTGTVAWRLPFADPLSVPLVWNNGWLIAATDAGRVLAFRATDGVLIWQRDLGVPLHASPALATDRLYLSTSTGRVVALRVDNGEVVWERRVGGEPNEILALDDRLYVGSTDNYLYAIDAAKGEIHWRWATGADVIGVPIADDKNVYFVSYDNVLRALDRRSGAQRWKRALPLRPTRGAVLAGNAVIVSGLSRTAPAFLLKTGAPAGEVSAVGELAAMPYPLERGAPMLVVVTRDFTEGTMVRALARSFEPPILPVTPLPNAVVPARPPGAPPAPPAAIPQTPQSNLPSGDQQNVPFRPNGPAH